MLNTSSIIWGDKVFEGRVSPHNYIDQFCLFLDNQGLLKRIKNGSLSATEKNPVILPSKHPFIKLLMTYVYSPHDETYHGGVNDTLVALYR